MHKHVEKIYETSKGYVVEDTEQCVLTVFEHTVRNFDGILGDDLNETRYNYKTGLYQSWSTTGYFARYFDKYKDREVALECAMKVIS